MKPFNLKEYLENPLRKVVTRDGQNVKIHCTNYIGSQKIIGQVEGYAFSTSFSEDGRCANDRDDSHLDLFFAPEKHEGYACVHFNEGIYYLDDTIYSSKEEALLESKKWGDFVATVKVEWEE